MAGLRARLPGLELTDHSHDLLAGNIRVVLIVRVEIGYRPLLHARLLLLLLLLLVLLAEQPIHIIYQLLFRSIIEPSLAILKPPLFLPIVILAIKLAGGLGSLPHERSAGRTVPTPLLLPPEPPKVIFQVGQAQSLLPFVKVDWFVGTVFLWVLELVLGFVQVGGLVEWAGRGGGGLRGTAGGQQAALEGEQLRAQGLLTNPALI